MLQASRRLPSSVLRSLRRPRSSTSKATADAIAGPSGREAANFDEWGDFLPTAEALANAYSAFYGQRRDRNAAREWDKLRKEGWKPDKRPGWDLRWWAAERRRGRESNDGPTRWHNLSVAPFASRRNKGKAVDRSTSPATSVHGRRELHTSLSSLRGVTSAARSSRLQPAIALQSGCDATVTPVSKLNEPDEDATYALSGTFEVEDETFKGTAVTIKPGSLVCVTSHGDEWAGIFLHRKTSSALCISIQGQARIAQVDEITFVVPDVVSARVAAKAGEGLFMLGDEVTASDLTDPRFADAAAARRECARALSSADVNRDEVAAELVKAGWWGVYHKLVQVSEYCSVHRTAQTLLGRQKVSVWSEWALHTLMMKDPDRFTWSPPLRSRSVFRLRQPKILALMQQLREWIRTDARPLQSFVHKAKRLVRRSRERTASSGGRTSSPWFVVGEDWSPDDRLIIDVFFACVNHSRRIQSLPLEQLTASVLKLVGTYVELSRSGWPAMGLDRHVAIQFLRDIGVLPPWQHPEMFADEINLFSRFRDDGEEPSPPRRSVDPLDSRRHDFGQLPVYVIDAADAQELDDGISLESGKDGSAWIHVHVADPTASLKPTDAAADLARERLQTVYNTGKSLPMLPEDFLHRARASLGSDDPDEHGQKCLTFSARIDQSTGDIIQSKVQAGVIRNIRRLTYDDVARILEPSQFSHPPTYLFCGNEPEGGWLHSTSSAGREMTADVVADIKAIEVYRYALMRNRVRDGAIGWYMPSPDPTLHTKPTISIGCFPRPRHFLDVPSISLQLPPPWRPDDRARWSASSQQPLVTEFMIMAGRIAADFARERDIPMPYRGQLPPIVDPEDLEAVRATIDLADPTSQGTCDFVQIMRKRLFFDVGQHSASPMPHFPLGFTNGYIRATSPLRRYSDLVAHWQIKKALLPASSSRQLKGFSYLDMKRIVELLDGKGKSIVQLEKKVNSAWSAYVLKDNLRRLADNPSSLPADVVQRLTGLVAITLQDPSYHPRMNMWTIRTYLPALGMRATLILKKAEEWFRDVSERKTGGGTGSWEGDIAAQKKDALAGFSVPVRIQTVTTEDHILLEMDRGRMHELQWLT